MTRLFVLIVLAVALGSGATAQPGGVEWEHIGFDQAFWVTFLPGSDPEGTLDTLFAGAKTEPDSFGFQINGYFRQDSGEWTDVTPFISGAGRSSLVVPSGCLFVGNAAGPNGIERTCDGGRTWYEPRWPDGDHIYVDCIYRRPSDGLLLGCVSVIEHQDLIVSYDGGDTWSELGVQFPSGSTEEPEDLIEHPTAADGGPRLIVGMQGFGYAYSDDGGATFTRSNAWNQGQYLPDDIAIDPFDGTPFDGRIYATTNDGLAPGPNEALLASDDGGATWTTLRHFPSGRAYVAVGGNGSLWVGTAEGSGRRGHVWRSVDGGATWEDVSGNYSEQYISDVTVGPDGRVYLATGYSSGPGGIEGGGIWRSVEPVTVATIPPHPDLSHLGIRVEPNPSAGQAVVRWEQSEPGMARVTLHDVRGREVAVIADNLRSSGEQRAEVETDALAPGIYVVRVVTEAGRASARLVVAR